MRSTDLRLRPADRSDLPALDAIALASKAHWGYDARQLLAWRDDLVVDPQSLDKWPVCVAELDGQLIGFTQLATETQPWELAALWVHPTQMRLGAGRALLAWARASASAAGQRELAIDADPNAEGFYLACGARRVGEVRAPIAGHADRVRPQLRLSCVEAHRA